MKNNSKSKMGIKHIISGFLTIMLISSNIQLFAHTNKVNENDEIEQEQDQVQIIEEVRTSS